MNLIELLPARYRETEDPLRTQRRIELVLALLLLLLVLQFAYGAVRLVLMSPPDPIMPSADSMQVPEVLSPESVTADQRNEILARPVFWASRRSVAEVGIRTDASAEKAAASQLKGVKLVGMFGGGQSSGIIALVKGKKRRILLGEEMDGWTLKSVQSSGVVLTSGARSETLTLERADSVVGAGEGADKSAATGAKSQPQAATGRKPRAYVKQTGEAAAVKKGDSAKQSPGLSLGGGVR